jgi:sulfite exporter TauE/SafE
MIYTAFIFGLISSLHCIGMCGAIAMMLPVNNANPTKKAVQIFLYHSGRLTAYGILGLLFGILGKGLYLAGIQQQLSIVMGVLMIVITLVPEKIFMKYNFSKPVYKTIALVKSSLGKQFKSKTFKSFYIIGLLNGFFALRISLCSTFWSTSNAKRYT